jgi:hypothetical protein
LLGLVKKDRAWLLNMEMNPTHKRFCVSEEEGQLMEADEEGDVAANDGEVVAAEAEADNPAVVEPLPTEMDEISRAAKKALKKREKKQTAPLSR